MRLCNKIMNVIWYCIILVVRISSLKRRGGIPVLYTLDTKYEDGTGTRVPGYPFHYLFGYPGQKIPGNPSTSLCCWSCIVYLQGVYLRSRQKLIITIWQSIHILTRQGRICVQSVTYGTKVVIIWICTIRHILAKMCIHVLSVRNVFRLRAIYIAIWIFIQVNTSAQNVAKCCGSSNDLAVHRRSHSGEKPFECTVCSKRFTTSGERVRHSRIHSGEKPYKCHVCEKAFSRSSHLHTHTRVHTGDKPYKCSLCNKSFSHSSNLQLHKRRAHSHSRPYNCPYCGKLFKTISELKCHVRIHTGAKPYSCSHCSQQFTQLSQLKTHLMKSHNEGTWLTCNICQKKFSDSGHLKVHLHRHAGVKPYVCSQCPKCFCTVHELKRHQLIHSDYKQFCCGLCSKDFKHKYYVVRHFKKCSAKLW